MKEEFKAFVKTKPELIDYVSKGSMTWQKFYEIWKLYGEDDKVWSKYKKEEKMVDSLNLSSIIDNVKKIDMDQVQKGINGLSKVVGLLTGLIGNKKMPDESYEPRQVFKKFED